MCTNCVLPASFPNIDYDENGVCNFCRNETFSLTEASVIDRARAEVETMFSNIAREGDYDAIACFSGGKDSTYTLQLATKKYGLKVLAFTLDNGFISNVAFKNINRVVDFLGIDHIVFRPSQPKMKSILKASTLFPIYNRRTLLRISANCQSCISMVNITALKLALEKKAPLILAGFTLGQIPANSIYYQNNYNFLAESREKSLQKLREYTDCDIEEYFSISDATLNSVNEFPFNVNLLCLENISEDDIVKEISQYGWKAPKDVDGCSSNCRLNSFNNMVHNKSLGYNPYALELSHLIRKGMLSRQQAIDKMNDTQEQQHDSIMTNLGITQKQLEKVSSIY